MDRRRASMRRGGSIVSPDAAASWHVELNGIAGNLDLIVLPR